MPLLSASEREGPSTLLRAGPRHTIQAARRDARGPFSSPGLPFFASLVHILMLGRDNPVRLLAVCLTLLTLCAGLLAQSTASSSSSAPRLEHFDPAMVDRDLNPCSDFFQYSCSKWLKANPIPSDQPGWGTFNSLGLWNIAAVRETPNRRRAHRELYPRRQKVGDTIPPARMSRGRPGLSRCSRPDASAAWRKSKLQN